MNCYLKVPDRTTQSVSVLKDLLAGLLSPNMNIHWVILNRVKEAKVRTCLQSSLPTYAIPSTPETGTDYLTNLWRRSCLSVLSVCLCQCFSFTDKARQWPLQAHSSESQAIQYSGTKPG